MHTQPTSGNPTDTFARLEEFTPGELTTSSVKPSLVRHPICFCGDDAFFQYVLRPRAISPSSEACCKYGRWLDLHCLFYLYPSQISKYPTSEGNTMADHGGRMADSLDHARLKFASQPQAAGSLIIERAGKLRRQVWERVDAKSPRSLSFGEHPSRPCQHLG